MSNSVDLNTLLGDAGLDNAATSAMMLTADTLGPAIMAGLGDVDIDDITTSEVTLVTKVIDDSGSIRMVAGNTQAVRDGANGVIDALNGSKQANSVLVSCRFLNDGVLYPYRMLNGAVKLDQHNFNPTGGTPLYRETEITLTTVAAKMSEFEQGGVAARSVTAIISDGGDNSGPVAPPSLRKMVEGLLKTEQHIIMGIGISDGYTNFDQVFQSMGIPANWIYTTNATPSDIRRAFAVVSQSAVRASQAATGSFSQVVLGGFNTP